VQRWRAVTLQSTTYLGSNVSGNLRHGRQARRQRFKIKTRTADQNGHAPLCDSLTKCRFDIAKPAADRVIFRCICVSVEAMGHPGLFVGCRPRRNDTQIAIHLHGIGVDNGPSEPLRQIERKGRLAAGGRPCNKHRSIGTVPRMTHVATLIGAPNAVAAALQSARAALPGAGTEQWLGPDAVDIPFNADNATDQRAATERLRAIASGIDAVVQPAASRRKKLFLADMDSTVIEQECIDELADYVGIKSRVAAITERAMRGEIAFEPALRERVGLLEGLPVSVIEEVLRDRIKLTPGAKTLVATMRANGAHTCMVSGGFTLFTDRIAAMVGFDASRANSLTIVDGHKLAGKVAEPIFGRDGKRAALIELRQEFALTKEETMAIGDGANDLDMISEAGLGVAYHAKPKVAAAAAARIDHSDLTALLYVQGYRRADFVDA
jgi:phosphoserine phosphatase